jgi:antitoxin component YwqK of YwqJK toxin-antitoxin module
MIFKVISAFFFFYFIISCNIEKDINNKKALHKMYFSECEYAYTYGSEENQICDINLSYDSKLKDGNWSLYFDKELKHIAVRFTIQNNLLNGLKRQWNCDKNLIIQTSYKNGNLEGEKFIWHENEKLKYKGNYKNSKKIDEHFLWDENGKLISKTDYFEGKKKIETFYKGDIKSHSYLYKNSPERIQILVSFDSVGFVKSSHKCVYDTIYNEEFNEEIIQVYIDSFDIDSLKK